MTVGPLQARIIGAIAGGILTLVAVLGIEATTEIQFAAEALAYGIVALIGFLGYGLSHKVLDKGRDG